VTDHQIAELELMLDDVGLRHLLETIAGLVPGPQGAALRASSEAIARGQRPAWLVYERYQR
jgi:hypothetical protein